MSIDTVPTERLLYRPTEAAHALGISRSKIYVLMAKGHLESVLVGGSRRIPRDALHAFVDGLRTGQHVPSGR